MCSSSKSLPALAGAIVLTACGGDITGEAGWHEDWNDAPPLTVCASGATYPTLGEAIAAAPSGSVIELCAGTYPERVVVEGKALWLRGAGAETTTLDGADLGVVLEVRGGAEVKVEGLSIQHGAATESGGGIRCTGGGLRLLDTAVRDNRAGGSGGGLHVHHCVVLFEGAVIEGNRAVGGGGGASLINVTGDITGSHFLGNEAEEGGGLTIVGGALGLHRNLVRDNQAHVRGGGLYLAGDAAIEDNTFSTNHAGWTGGGLHLHQSASTLSRNTVHANTAVEEAGGIYVHQGAPVLRENQVTDNRADDDGAGIRLFESRARLERNVIARNHAGGDGGGLKISHLPALLIDNQISDNDAAGVGGGLELDNDSSVVRGGAITGNHASGDGGGIHIQLWPWNDGLVENVRIADNRASDGAAVYVEQSFQLVTLRGLTLVDNRAGQGGAVYFRGAPVRFTNSLLARNRAEEGGGIYLKIAPPWTDACPCPPVDPAVELAFLTVHGNTAPAGAAVWTNAPNVTITSSIFEGNVGNTSVTVADFRAPVWRYNDTAPATFAGMFDPTGGDGNLAMPPAFTNPAAGDFRLLATSPCIDAGDPAVADRDGSRADMGLFAGPNPP